MTQCSTSCAVVFVYFVFLAPLLSALTKQSTSGHCQEHHTVLISQDAKQG